MQHDPVFPLHEPSEVAEVLSGFFGEPSHNAIAHNAAYDLRCIFKLGVNVQCRITCTLINAHRIDENIRQFGKEPTYHDYANATSKQTFPWVFPWGSIPVCIRSDS